MKLAEALLQDKPIKRELFKQWCRPEIVESGVSPFAALPTVSGTDKYTLDYNNMAADDWEIKLEPLKHEFKSEVLDALGTGYLHFYIVPSSFIGKKVKVTVEEIVE